MPDNSTSSKGNTDLYLGPSRKVVNGVLSELVEIGSMVTSESIGAY